MNGPNGRGGQSGLNSEDERLIPDHGGYRNLKSFQIARLVYDVTVRFCNRYIDKRDRTHDQMVQAARSGVQNIAEGSQASGTSKKIELKLTNIARASLEELRLDYEDFLRQRKMPIWERDDPRREGLINRRCGNVDEFAQWVEKIHKKGQRSVKQKDKMSIESTSSTKSTYPEIAANAALVLITVASSLLRRQLDAQSKAFEEDGGFSERLYNRRKRARRKRQS